MAERLLLNVSVSTVHGISASFYPLQVPSPSLLDVESPGRAHHCTCCLHPRREWWCPQGGGCFWMLLKLPAFKAPEESCIACTSGSPGQKMPLPCSAHISYHLSGESFRHVTSCLLLFLIKIGVRKKIHFTKLQWGIQWENVYKCT